MGFDTKVCRNVEDYRFLFILILWGIQSNVEVINLATHSHYSRGQRHLVMPTGWDSALHCFDQKFWSLRVYRVWRSVWHTEGRENSKGAKVRYLVKYALNFRVRNRRQRTEIVLHDDKSRTIIWPLKGSHSSSEGKWPKGSIKPTKNNIYPYERGDCGPLTLGDGWRHASYNSTKKPGSNIACSYSGEASLFRPLGRGPKEEILYDCLHQIKCGTNPCINHQITNQTTNTNKAKLFFIVSEEINYFVVGWSTSMAIRD
jgi:hypothetical protein